MKKLFSLLLAVILILPMGACAKGGGNVANYLYNGVELPDINEVWDKETYPYALISNAIGAYYVIFSESPLRYDTETGTFEQAANNWIRYDCPRGEWEFSKNGNVPPNPMWLIVFWTSYDFYETNGTLRFAASIPILADSKLSVSVKTAAEGNMLYNGVELPKPPEWDKETYPYAQIQANMYGNPLRFSFRVFDSRPYYSDAGLAPKLLFADGSSNVRYCIFGHDDSGEWGNFTEAVVVTDQNDPENRIWTNTDILNEDGSIYLAASEPVAGGVTNTTATFNFTCSNLLYTDTAYRIKAWCYPKGMDYWTAPATWESDLFAGTDHSESVTFTDLLPGTEYEVYACIYANGTATEHNAHTTFTTPVNEEGTLEAVVLCNQVTENSFVAWLLAIGLDSSKEYTAVFEALENDETSAGSKTVTVSGSSVSQSCAFTGLKPNTDYVVYVDLYTEDRLVFSGEYEVTTLEGEIPGGYDRDSFLLGFASGLGCTAATKDGAEYNSWAQGYIVGSALRKAL